MSSFTLTILHEMIQVSLENPPQVAGEYLTPLEEAVDSRSQVVINWPPFVANGVRYNSPAQTSRLGSGFQKALAPSKRRFLV